MVGVKIRVRVRVSVRVRLRNTVGVLLWLDGKAQHGVRVSVTAPGG